MPLRITFLIRELAMAGAERQLAQLACDLAQRGHKVRVVTFYPIRAFGDALMDAGVETEVLDKAGRWDVVGFIKRLRRALRRGSPQIIHSYMPMANVLASLVGQGLGVRIVWGMRSSQLDPRHYNWLFRVETALETFLSRTASLIIANSEAGRQACLNRKFPGHRLTVIRNGIDTVRFRPRTTRTGSLRQSLGIPEGTALIGLVGRVEPVKGHDILLRALAMLQSPGAAPHLAFIGAPANAGFNQELRILAHDLGLSDRIHWLPPRDDMPDVYSDLDIYCSASRSEGFSNVIAEAMACRCPVVVTDVGDSATIVGATGRVIPPENPEALSAALTDLLKLTAEEREHLTAQAKERVECLFSRARVAGDTEAALTPLVSV